MKRRLLLSLIAVALVGAFLTACGKAGDKTEGNPNPKFHGPAMAIQDGANKYDPNQGNCPVCNKGPINPDFYHDIEGEGRIYFDKEECMKKFKQNPQEHLKGYTKTGSKSYQEMMQQQK